MERLFIQLKKWPLWLVLWSRVTYWACVRWIYLVQRAGTTWWACPARPVMSQRRACPARPVMSQRRAWHCGMIDRCPSGSEWGWDLEALNAFALAQTLRPPVARPSETWHTRSSNTVSLLCFSSPRSEDTFSRCVFSVRRDGNVWKREEEEKCVWIRGKVG